MSFPYKNPISPNQLTGQQSLDRTKTYGTSYSTLSTGGYMEVYSLNQLQYTIPPSTYGPIEFSGNSIPITFSKGSGATFSFDTITLQPDNISSGRRKLGMLVYVKEVNQVYQYNIDNYFNLFTAATASTGTIVFSDFGTTIKSNSAAGIAFINAWTANTIDGVGGITNPTAVWKKYYGNNISITGGSFNTITGTLTLTNITGGTQNLTGFGSGGGGGTTITGGTFDKNTETLTLSSSGGSIFITGFTDVYTTGGTYDNGAKTLELYDNSGNTVLITGFTSPSSGTTVGAYGSFSLNTNLVVSGANTETIWTYDTDEISNGIYISGGSKIRVTQYGVYSIGYSAQIEKTQGGTATDVTIWAKINGNNVDRSSSTTTLVSNSAYILPFVSYTFELYPEDYLEFYFSAPSQYVQLTTLSGLTSPTRPNSPALIVVGQSVLGTIATFTGNTSATCISDLYVDNIYGCSPINVNDLLLVNSGVTSNGTYGLASMNASNNPSMLVISGSGTVGGASYIDFIRVTNTSVGATNPTKTIRVNNTGGIEFLNNAYTAQILNLADNGNLFVGGGNIATTSLNDGVSNYLSFNLNNSQIYDDGNFHIHSRGVGQAMWLNSNNGSIIIGNQSPVAGGGAASSIIMGSGSTTTRALVNVYGSKTYTIGAYGFLATIGAGTGAGTTAPYSLYCNNRVEATEFDATSDERLKDIQGEIQLDDAINLVNNIKPIKYTWKDSEDKGIKAGYSAQQVEKVGYKHLIGHIPNEDLTATTDSDGFTSPEGFQLTMNYDQVTPYHGVVIKHLLEEIEKLKQEIEILKNK